MCGIFTRISVSKLANPIDMLRLMWNQKYEKKCEILRWKSFLKSLFFVKRYYRTKYGNEMNRIMEFMNLHEN